MRIAIQSGIPALALIFATLGAQPVTKEFPFSSEKELTVIVDVSFGTLVFERAGKENVAVVRYEDPNEDRDRLQISYETGSRGKLRIRSKSSSEVFGDDNRHVENRRIVVQYTDRVPISFDVELGAGRGELDLTGLKVQEFRLSTGASDVRLWCNEPNAIPADNVEIESGVSKFSAENLSNLNFRRLTFSGGVGSYHLDFGGTLVRDADVSIDVGLGAVVVNIPEEINARIHYDDGWFSRFSMTGEFRRTKSGVYETEGYGDARRRLDISIDAGLGSVKIRRR